jgi:glycosyltransferase involved in cell wall biosynthesis
MTAIPAVSIIMPAFNASRTLARTIKSVRLQTCTEWELLIVNDGSTDETYKRACEFAALDKRIKVISQPNRGPSAARNAGIAKAHGAFIAFLDADDLWHPYRLAGLLNIFDLRPQAGVLFTRVRFFDPNSQGSRTVSPHKKRLELKNLLSENPTCTSSNIMIRRHVLDQAGTFDDALRQGEDVELLMRVAALTPWTIEGVNRVWISYACDPLSLSSDVGALDEAWQTLMSRAERLAPDLFARNRRSITGQYYRKQARRALRAGGSLRQARDYIARAFSADPLLLFHSPRRTVLTLLGLALASIHLNAAREIAQ